MQKILIIRFSSIGDIILTTPVIRCLKTQLKCELHYVTKKSYAGILEANPHIDKVIAFDHEIDDVIQELQTENYDFVVDLHRNLRSTRLKKKLKKPSASFPKLNRQKFIYTTFKKDVMPDVHIVDRYFEAVKRLSVSNDQMGLDYFIPKEDEVNLHEYQIPSDYIAFSLGAQFATKRLPNHKIIEIIQGVEGQVVLLGGPDDSENAKTVEEACKNTINLVGKLNLNQSASVVKQAKVVITHDTGLMHVAAAFNKRIVSVWGNTTPKLGMYPYLPKSANNFTTHEVEVNCRPCSKIGYQKCPKKHFKCMEQQDVKTIITALKASNN
ncbi:MAG: glycosyltransferase family 9 protein [Crocinitomicaceae bacterium]